MSDLYLGPARYLAALHRIKGVIENGVDLLYFDDSTRGAKDMGCSWGFCLSEESHWPDAQDYKWPDQPTRIAPKYRRSGSRCPLDTRAIGGDDLNGCFWTCRVFQRKLTTPSRKEAIALYDARIQEAIALYGARIQELEVIK